MSCAVKRAVLLLLVAAVVISSSADQKCDGVNKNPPKEDLHKIFGDWVLVWAVNDNPHPQNLFSNMSSSHLEFRLLADNKSIVFTERNLLHSEKCIKYVWNMSVDSSQSDHHTLTTDSATVEKDGVVQPTNDSDVIHMYKSDPDSMVLVYINEYGRALWIYRREGHHSDIEDLTAAHKHHQLRAECLGLPVDRPYIYDGVSHFCHRKSSENVKQEES